MASKGQKDSGKKGDGSKQAAVVPQQTSSKKTAAELLDSTEKSAKEGHDPLLKTRLCKTFIADGVCKFGDKCMFAHGQHDLRVPGDAKGGAIPPQPVASGSRSEDKMEGLKTRLCKTFIADGVCKFGDKCMFAHGQHDLRVPGDAKGGAIPPQPLASGNKSEEKIEACICASCPAMYQDEVSAVCLNLGIQKAFGKAGDMLDSLSGKEWLGKWEAKVVMATVTKANTLNAHRARIICISGGPHCDLEMAQQPRLVRAIKKEMDDENFAVKVEWLEIKQFREDYVSGYRAAREETRSPAAGIGDGKPKSFKEVEIQDGKTSGGVKAKSANSGSEVKQAAGDSRSKKETSDAQGRQPNNDGNGKAKQSSSDAKGGADSKSRPGRGDADGKSRPSDGKASQVSSDSKGKPPGLSSSKQQAALSPSPASGKSKTGESESGKMFCCKQCDKQFSARMALVQHQGSTGHAGISRGNQAGKRKEEPPNVWVCGECEKEFASEAACDQHQTSTGHSDPTCACGKAFCSMGALQQHMRATGHDAMSSGSSEDESYLPNTFDQSLWLDKGSTFTFTSMQPEPGVRQAQPMPQTTSQQASIQRGPGPTIADGLVAAAAVAVAAAAGFSLYSLGREDEKKDKPGSGSGPRRG